ncbi:hypothetical protein TNCV_2501741 [Trichonephila clavipes]|nr:hypothetical protein TNCV_2501741 [Trichonephila clavipes]
MPVKVLASCLRVDPDYQSVLTPVKFLANPYLHVAKVPRVVSRRKINFCPPHRTDSQKRRLFMPFSNGLSPEGVNLRSGIRSFLHNLTSYWFAKVIIFRIVKIFF